MLKPWVSPLDSSVATSPRSSKTGGSGSLSAVTAARRDQAEGWEVTASVSVLEWTELREDVSGGLDEGALLDDWRVVL